FVLVDRHAVGSLDLLSALIELDRLADGPVPNAEEVAGNDEWKSRESLVQRHAVLVREVKHGGEEKQVRAVVAKLSVLRNRGGRVGVDGFLQVQVADFEDGTILKSPATEDLEAGLKRARAAHGFGIQAFVAVTEESARNAGDAERSAFEFLQAADRYPLTVDGIALLPHHEFAAKEQPTLVDAIVAKRHGQLDVGARKISALPAGRPRPKRQARHE